MWLEWRPISGIKQTTGKVGSMKVETLITRRLLRAGLLTSILVLHATFARAQVPNCAPGLDASYVASVHSGSFPGSSFAFVSPAGFDNCASLPTGTPSSDLPQGIGRASCRERG